MSLIKTLEDLEKIREEAKDLIDCRVENEKKTRVVVGMGTCGIAAGDCDDGHARRNQKEKSARCHSN